MVVVVVGRVRNGVYCGSEAGGGVRRSPDNDNDGDGGSSAVGR